MWQILWVNEFVWMLDIARKFFDKPKSSLAQDSYEVATNYIKSTLILDLIAILPQLISGLNPNLVVLKIIRLYQFSVLYYPLEALFKFVYSERDQRYIFTIVYACSTLTQIFLLMHCLAVFWVWIGSESFIDYQEGAEPW